MIEGLFYLLQALVKSISKITTIYKFFFNDYLKK